MSNAVEENEKTTVVDASKLVVGNKFRIAGWKAVITEVIFPQDIPYVWIEFNVGGSSYQRGSFDTPIDAPFTIIVEAENLCLKETDHE